jgi:DNA-binding NarL/FixJ family response regulator
VLIIDDDRRVLAALRETVGLEPDLVVVGGAGDVMAARRLAFRTRPDVVLLDVLLPDVAGGLELLTDLQRRPECSVVAMSIRGDLRAAALRARAGAVVDKGDGIEAVLCSLRAVGRPVV